MTTQFFGERIKQNEDPRLLMEWALFGDDVQLANMAHVAFVRSPYTHARIVSAAAARPNVTIQTRKTYVSLVTLRRTFARIQPTTRKRVDLALRLDGQKPGGRLGPSKIHETMPVQISLTTVAEVDAELLDWLQRAYDKNC